MELFKLEKDEDIQSIYSLDDLSDDESIYSIESINMIDSNSEDSSSTNSDLEEYMCAFIEEQHEEEYKYINLGWPEKCHNCSKLVANKYYNTYSILCEKCYSNRLVEINSA